MKWIIIALAAAAALIGIGLVATGSRDHGRGLAQPRGRARCATRAPPTCTPSGCGPRSKSWASAWRRTPSLAEASISRTLAFLQLGERQNMKRELARADSLTAALKRRPAAPGGRSCA